MLFKSSFYRLRAVLFAPLMLILGCAPNHFLGYKDAIPQQPNGAQVLLQDQFRTAKNRVLEPVYFFNPVQKTKWTGGHQEPVVSKIRYKDHHLIAYDIQTEDMQPRVVWVKNQFSTAWQRVQVRQPKYLLVPTQKIKPNLHNVPKRLDHYLCYEIVGEKMDVRVALKDQFQGYDYMPTGDPCLLCNPVRKTHNGRIVPIRNKKWHLVGYKLDKPLPEIIPVTGNNQFANEMLRLNNLDLLLVPSLKDTVARSN